MLVMQLFAPSLSLSRFADANAAYALEAPALYRRNKMKLTLSAGAATDAMFGVEIGLPSGTRT